MLIEQPWGVSAFGQGTAYCEPDYAVVSVAINRVNNEPAAALHAAKEAAERIRSLLQGRDVAQGDVTASRTVLRSAYDGFGESRRFLGHGCRIAFAIRVADLNGVDELVVDLVGAGADEIVSVMYDSVRRPEIRAAARREAVGIARSKAEVYAEMAGVQLGPIVHIEDVDPEHLRTELHSFPGNRVGAAAEALAPGQITVPAAVVLGFSIAR